MAFLKRDLPKRSDNLSEWYNKVVLLAELADYGPARGTMIYRPYGYAIWELLQREMDARMKEHGVANAYFPLFIPESLIRKEAAHIEGFSPELAVVTIGGGEELREKLVVRPTSETIMYEAYSRWIHSWRDLPLMINQWNNVVRWEKRTYLFLRTTEFLWQEGHTAHATHEDAWETVRWAIEMYAKTYRDHLAIPGYIGRKSEAERFAGADVTLTYESLMPEGRVLQSSTAHDLGQNFSRTFDITFQNKEGGMDYVWQTSWGLSTRSIGGLILMHGDDGGLRLPPRLSPIQAVIIPVKNEAPLLDCSERVKVELYEAGVRVFVDASDNETMGSKINTWELKGVPIRIEIGAREVSKKALTLVRRDIGEKIPIAQSELVGRTLSLLDDIQQNLYQEAEKFLRENTRSVETYDDFKITLAERRGFLAALWCEDPVCEKSIKEETKATTRCLPLDAEETNGPCVYCQKPATHRWLFGQAY